MYKARRTNSCWYASFVVFHSNTHLAAAFDQILDTNIVYTQLDVLEYKCPATSFVVILQTVLMVCCTALTVCSLFNDGGLTGAAELEFERISTSV
jgi:hypothetical protein